MEGGVPKEVSAVLKYENQKLVKSHTELLTEINSTLLSAQSIMKQVESAEEKLLRNMEQARVEFAGTKNDTMQVLAYAKKIIEMVEKGKSSRMQVLNSIAEKLQNAAKGSVEQQQTVVDSLVKIAKCMEDQTQNQAQIVGQLKSVVEYISTDQDVGGTQAGTNPFEDMGTETKPVARKSTKTKRTKRR